MASSLFALLDDIATILDDIAMLTNVAARKTAGVLGDDLALNAQQVTGVRADREIPVVWAVAVGSLRNKAILVPAALAVSAVAPWLVSPVLMIGGTYLCYEGAEKLAHKLLHSKSEDDAHERKLANALLDPNADLAVLERDKIKGAIRTDFVLSAEIIVITLGSAAGTPFMVRVGVLVGVALLMTAGVYGLVAAIVKIDDLGLHLSLKGGISRTVGRGLIGAAPWLMRALSVAGTAAMFLVGGGILTHGIPPLHHATEQAASFLAGLPAIGSLLSAAAPPAIDALTGFAAGAIAVGVAQLIPRKAG